VSLCMRSVHPSKGVNTTLAFLCYHPRKGEVYAAAQRSGPARLDPVSKAMVMPSMPRLGLASFRCQRYLVTVAVVFRKRRTGPIAKFAMKNWAIAPIGRPIVG